VATEAMVTEKPEKKPTMPIPPGDMGHGLLIDWCWEDRQAICQHQLNQSVSPET